MSCPTLWDPMETQGSCPPLSPGVCSNSCPLSQWCYLTTSSSVIPYSSCLQSFPSIRVFFWKPTLHIRGPKCWGFSFSISPSNEYSRWISFRIDRFDLLAVQGTLKSLLQHHSLKASVLQALSLLYGPALTSIHDYWKNHSFDYTNLCQQGSLIFNMLSRLVIAFLLRSKCLLI